MVKWGSGGGQITGQRQLRRQSPPGRRVAPRSRGGDSSGRGLQGWSSVGRPTERGRTGCVDVVVRAVAKSRNHVCNGVNSREAMDHGPGIPLHLCPSQPPGRKDSSSMTSDDNGAMPATRSRRHPPPGSPSHTCSLAPRSGPEEHACWPSTATPLSTRLLRATI
jgi:hypothetical protein